MKIIIISSVDRIREFFKLEALNFSYSVDCFERFEKIHQDISSYDLSIIDIDTVSKAPLNNAKKAITLSQFDKKADIFYPIRISELRSLYKNLLLNDTVTENASSAQASPNIIFYKKEKNLISYLGKKYILSDSEYKVLSLLCKSSKKEVSRKELDLIFDAEKGNISDVYICKLRKKLEEPFGKKIIATIRGKGYKLLVDSELR